MSSWVGGLAVLVPIALGAIGSGTADQGSPATRELWPDVEMRELSPKEWFRRVQNKLSEKYGVDPSELHFSAPPPKMAAFVRGPAVRSPRGKRSPKVRPRGHEIVVVDVLGQKRGQFRAVTARGSAAPPRDLRFLTDDRLIYEAVARAPRPARTRPVLKKARRPASDSTAAPKRLFVIQPIARRARPIRCEGVRFAFTGKHDRVAFVAGRPTAAFVSVNGVQVYPRRGRSIIPSDLAWSRDGSALAFLETPPRKPARLVLLAATDNPREDVTWNIPPSTSLDGARVFWARPGKLVVGKTSARPLFTASFTRQEAGDDESFTP